MLTRLDDLVRRGAPERPAVTFKDGTLTYGRLAEQVGAAAAGLRALGLERGDRVLVYLEKRLETVVALFAASAAGLVVVPVNPLLKAGQVAYIAADCTRAGGPDHPRAAADRSAGTCPSAVAHVFVVGTRAGTDDHAGAAAGDRLDRAAPDGRAETQSPVTGRSTPTWPRSSTPPAAPASPRAWCSRTATWSRAPRAWPATSAHTADDVILSRRCR